MQNRDIFNASLRTDLQTGSCRGDGLACCTSSLREKPSEAASVQKVQAAHDQGNKVGDVETGPLYSFAYGSVTKKKRHANANGSPVANTLLVMKLTTSSSQF